MDILIGGIAAFLAIVIVVACLIVIVGVEQIVEWAIAHFFRLLVRLGIRAWDNGRNQVQAQRKRALRNAVLRREPKRSLLRSSQPPAADVLLRPIMLGTTTASEELLRPVGAVPRRD